MFARARRKICVFMASPLTRFLIIQASPRVNYSVEPALLSGGNNLRDEAATGVFKMSNKFSEQEQYADVLKYSAEPRKHSWLLPGLLCTEICS